MGGIALCSMGNLYNQRIWVKYDVEKKYVLMEDYTIEGQVGVGEVSVGGSVSVSKKYDWVKIQAQFTPIPSNEFIELAVDCKDRKVMYVTIIGDDKKVICNTLGQVDKNLIVTENGLLRLASAKNFMQVHSKYKKMKQRSPGSYSSTVQENARSSKSIECAGEQSCCKERQQITTFSAMKSTTINIKDKDDNWGCGIREIAVTSDTVLLTYWNNDNIASVSTDGNVMSVLSLPTSPTSVTVLYTTTAVAAGEDKKLYIIDITNQTTLSLRRQCQLKYSVSNIIPYYGNLIVTCHTIQRCTKMITLDNEELWSVSEDESGRDLFSFPSGIATTTINGCAVIVVTDYWENTLTLLEAETGRLVRIIDVGEKRPRGITVDKDGNIYVCYSGIGEIYVWSNDFKDSKIILSRDDLGGGPPVHIVYSSANDILFVSYHKWTNKKNTVDCFRLLK